MPLSDESFVISRFVFIEILRNGIGASGLVQVSKIDTIF